MSSIFLAVSHIYPMLIEPTITWVPSGFSAGYIWLDTKTVLKKFKGMKANLKRWVLSFERNVETDNELWVSGGRELKSLGAMKEPAPKRAGSEKSRL